MSSTVAKALGLLNNFSENEPEFGLSDLARRSGADKATVHRMLTVLADTGLLEQDTTTKLYRLGAGILRLARIREATFPVSAVVEPVLARLSEATGETAHASLISGDKLVTIGISPSPKPNRVSLEAGEVLGFHSTASGLVFLAFSPEALIEQHLSGELAPHTAHTETTPASLQKRIVDARKNGFGFADRTHEEEVYGIAAPLFHASSTAYGAIAVATPSHRMTPALRTTIIDQVMQAAISVTRSLGGEPPEVYLDSAKARAA